MRYQVKSRTNPPVSLDLAKEHLRVTHDLEDNLIQLDVDSATEWAEVYTGRGYGDVTIDALTELDTDVYYLTRYLPATTVVGVVDSDSNAVGFEFEAPNKVTITDELSEDAYPLTIEFTSFNEVSPVVKSAILLRLGDLYDYRTDRPMTLTKDGLNRRVAEEMLQPYKLNEFSP